MERRWYRVDSSSGVGGHGGANQRSSVAVANQPEQHFALALESTSSQPRSSREVFGTF